MNTKHKHDLPVESGELRKLAYVLQISSTDELLESCEHYRKIILKLSQNHYARVRAEALAMPKFAQR